jgi:hypothetical protein
VLVPLALACSHRRLVIRPAYGLIRPASCVASLAASYGSWRPYRPSGEAQEREAAVRISNSVNRYRREAILRHHLMRRSERIRTYIYIGTAVASFAIAVALGISMGADPDFSRGDVSALFSILGTLVLSVSLLWIRYVQKPRGS